ncbi:uncharacterized protein LOC125344544 [Perognathus longimembris pacificus]|uniref:uncharacterized protein LOC125344544 n=1 Tax=Perognathus longimembris pacificus TaxID=214514 RepID=UPI002018953F|nr:uncharacterized protein LOC125344544 [Perognathus longimembris pacificus]
MIAIRAGIIKLDVQEEKHRAREKPRNMKDKNDWDQTTVHLFLRIFSGLLNISFPYSTFSTSSKNICDFPIIQMCEFTFKKYSEVLDWQTGWPPLLLYGLGFWIKLSKSRSWRIWEFDSNIVQVVFIGLWEAYYYQKFNVSGSIVELPMHSTINASWIISPELQYGQDMILLANFMKSVVLVFSTQAILVSWIKAPFPEFLRSCYNISIFFLVLSSGCTVGAVSWNYAVEFYGQSTLDFPVTFPVEKEALIKKHLSHVFPLGILTATFSLFGATMLMFETCSLKRKNKVKPVSMA